MAKQQSVQKSHSFANKLAVAVMLQLAVAGGTTYSAMCAPPPADLKPAIASYNAKKYGQAVSQLKAVGGASANNPYTHYYMALSYQALGQFAEAEKEYKWNYDRNLDKDLRYKSWQGLNGLSSAKRTRTASSSSSNSSSPSSAGAGAQKSSEMTSVNLRPGGTGGSMENPFDYKWTPGCVRHGGGR